MPWNQQTPTPPAGKHPLGMPSMVLLVSAEGAAPARSTRAQHPALVKDQWYTTNKPAKHKDSPTSGTVKPWGWEWACPLPSASLQGPGIPGREEERGDSCKRSSLEAPGRSPPSQDSSKLVSILGSQGESN